MRLDFLLKDLPVEPVGNPAWAQMEISGISCDPNLCKSGYLYLAAESETVDSTRFGLRLDGRDYIKQALANGALAVLTSPEQTLPPEQSNSAVLLKIAEPLRLLGTLCARLHAEPRPEHLALVTGTNGKTSTVNFCRMLWTADGKPSCSIGNLGGVCSDGSLVWDRDPTLSVPETVTLHKILQDIAGRGFEHVAMEATSHALFDYRLHGLNATIGAFSNLTRDHLDFHGTMEEYFRVKMTLFNDVLAPGSFAVLNADSPWFEKAEAICRDRKHQVIAFGRAGKEIRLLNVKTDGDGQNLKLEIFGKVYETRLNLLGYFQVLNVLCSLGIVSASGLDAEKAVKYVETLSEVEGRLNLVSRAPSGGKIIVDFAHTPDGIRAALEACRSFTEGKLFIVFACDGERDPGGRAEMGEIASSMADQVIVSTGHWRAEDPAQIRKAVLAGVPSALEIADREKAIEHGIRALDKDDTLLIAGFGHEKFLTQGNVTRPYSDTDTVLRIVAKLAKAII
ncbi:MAG: UDP-N-acetylmuramoyl-L-alanyl-D-glutamate--2,6-diaminopimelate ligase [Candidatus Obscuribacterales bacterium]|nr:UDP-N-acetylmuramoyl-L-alanyl-D-glutamate--2,6-diaminopimelate ligase [Candidatus Obscuribacterales bacterium]